MKKTFEPIRLLPQFDSLLPFDNDKFYEVFRERLRIAATLDYVPDSLETLRTIEYADVKLLMSHNIPFFNAAMSVCGELVSKAIEFYKSCDDEGETDGVETLDDLLDCGYFGPDYESARSEFANCFVEDFVFEGLDFIRRMVIQDQYRQTHDGRL